MILNIDVQGARTLMEDGIPATFIFVAPPSPEVLEERLKRRGTDDPRSLALRLENAKEELRQQERFDHRVVNDELAAAVEKLVTILDGGREKTPSEDPSGFPRRG